MEIGLIIRKAREDKHIKQATIANYLNIDQSIYSKIENGTRKVKTDEIVVISNFLKLPLYHFFPNTITELENENLKEQIKALREDNNNKNEIIKSLFATIKKLENDKT